MNSNSEVAADPAAVFACANSLWEECRKAALQDETLDLSSAYSGWDQLMREVMRIGDLFENGHASTLTLKLRVKCGLTCSGVDLEGRVFESCIQPISRNLMSRTVCG